MTTTPPVNGDGEIQEDGELVLRARFQQLAAHAPAFRGLDPMAEGVGPQAVEEEARRGRRGRVAIAVSIAAAAVLVGTALLVPLALGGDSEFTAVDPSLTPKGQPPEVVRGRLALPVPKGAQLVHSTTCDGDGVTGDAVIVTDGPIDQCVHSQSRALRIYVTSLAHPPFGESWESVSVPGPLIGAVQTRSLNGDSSLVRSNATYVTALIAPSEDTAFVVAGARTPAEAADILGSIRAR